MNNINPVEILRYGVIGLGFLLALLSYNLLIREQKKDNPRGNVLKAINIFMAFSIILCLIGVLGDFLKGDPKSSLKISSSKVTLQLLEARPGKTTVGTSQASTKEIDNILINRVAANLDKTCFEEKTDIDLYGKIDFLIYKGSNGFANNWSISETNIDESYHSCIRDVFGGTQFPEPTDPTDTFRDEKTGKPIPFLPEYWVSVLLKVKK